MDQINPALSEKFKEALTLTFNLHGRAFRKSGTTPYLAHLLSVCSLVLYDGGDENEAIAALLHDALEDQAEKINRADIESRFGQKVLDIILVSIDTPEDYKGGKKPAWRERKANYIQHIHMAKPEYLRVTIADKVDNARAMLRDYQEVGEKLWEKFNAPRDDQIWYYTEALKAYQQSGLKSSLLCELEKLVAQLTSLK